MTQATRTNLPDDPFGQVEQALFQPAARRECTILGAPVELLWLPERKQRRGVPTGRRPAFLASPADRILREEAVWQGGGTVITGNPYPFGERQLLLWATDAVREPTRAMLEIGFRLEQATGGTVLINSTGAAASMTRAHLHLLSERRGFLTSLSATQFEPDYLDSRDLDAVYRITEPVLAIGVRGSPLARAAAAHRLLELRTCPSFNLVSSDGTTWVFPRSLEEIPRPHFPHAVGAAEVWGRWCYSDREDFEQATPAQLLTALKTSLWVPSAAES